MHAATWYVCTAFAVAGAYLMGITVGRSMCVCGQAASNQAYDMYQQKNQSSSARSTSSPLVRQEGWASIEVFYGNTSHLTQENPKQEWYAQSGQDIAVSDILKGKQGGFFVDLAANHPTFLSNTYSLEQNFNWTGLCIEPNPMHWPNLVYRKCRVVGAVVGKQTMDEVTFKFLNADGVGGHGGIVGASFDNKQASIKDTSPRYTVTLKDIFSKFSVPKHIDYLSLDVEGAEEFIMSSFPFDYYQISIMTIERPKLKLKTLLESQGYQIISTMSSYGETIWAHESVSIPANFTDKYSGIKDWDYDESKVF